MNSFQLTKYAVVNKDTAIFRIFTKKAMEKFIQSSEIAYAMIST
jgi:hypothetical protein